MTNQLASLTRDINVVFHDDPQEEVQHLYHEAGIVGLISWLNEDDNKGKDLPQELKEDIGRHIAYLADMFSANLPSIEGQTPEAVIRHAARDIQISRILKERGLARLYRLCRSYVTLDVPTDALGGSRTVKVRTYQTLKDPETGEPFTHQEPFLGWFSRSSHISRSLIFMRFADLDRLTEALSMPLEEAYNTLLTKPKVIGDVLRDIADWTGSQISFIRPDVADRLADVTMSNDPEMADSIKEYAQVYRETGDFVDMQNLINATVPAISNLVQEVSMHENARDAKRMVQDSILMLPEISYSWDTTYDGLVIEMITTEVDENGNTYETGKQAYLLLPDSVEKLPQPIKNDIIKRLPIRNRESLDSSQ